MKRVITIVALGLLLSGCVSQPVVDSLDAVIRTLGEPCIEYSKNDPNCSKEKLEAREKVLKAAKEVVKVARGTEEEK